MEISSNKSNNQSALLTLLVKNNAKRASAKRADKVDTEFQPDRTF